MKHDSVPSSFLRAVADRMPHGDVLDVACGGGRNARLFLERGDTVFGIDRSRESLLRARETLGSLGPLHLAQADLEEMPLPRSRFDVIVNVRYLQRSLVPAMCAALRPGGMLAFETFLVEQLALGHPRNPDFVLQHGELRELFGDLRVLHYEEGRFGDGAAEAFLARLLAQRP